MTLSSNSTFGQAISKGLDVGKRIPNATFSFKNEEGF